MEKLLKMIRQTKKVIDELIPLALSIGTLLAVIKMIIESL